MTNDKKQAFKGLQEEVTTLKKRNYLETIPSYTKASVEEINKDK